MINDFTRYSEIFFVNTRRVQHIGFLENHSFVKYYGLTDDEVREKLNKFNILQEHENVKRYYNGYKVQSSGDSIYNTRSVMNYLQTEDLKVYWIEEPGLRNLSEVFLQKHIRRAVYILLSGRTTTVHRFHRVSFCHTMYLKRLMERGSFTTTLWIAEYFIIFLSDNGYFNYVFTHDDRIMLNIPNTEIYNHLPTFLPEKFIP